MSKTPIVKCPTCQKEVVWEAKSQFRPFCSKRCKTIDLAAWASGDYAIPVVEMDDVTLPEDEEETGQSLKH